MKRKRVKVILLVIGIIAFIIVGINFDKIFGNYHDKFLVAEGSLSLEESTEGYVLREEIVLQNDEPDNGMVQIVPDGEKAAKNEAVYRYYSDSEDRILEEISNLDIQISDEIEQNGSNLISSDISSIERQIESTINEMYKINDVKKTNEYRAELDSYMTKKAQITGEISASDSRIRQLTNQRNDLQKQLEAESKIVYAPESGVVSYRVDGLEDVLKVDGFKDLTEEKLNDLDVKTGQIVSTSTEQGKVINNFECYVATILNSNASKQAEVGKKAKITLSSGNELEVTIAYKQEQENGKVLVVLKTNALPEELIIFRKISFNITWWSVTGIKVPNNAILEDETQSKYVLKKTTTGTTKCYIKVKKTNDKYSIISSYTADDLKALGIDEAKYKGIEVYDTIMLYPKK